MRQSHIVLGLDRVRVFKMEVVLNIADKPLTVKFKDVSNNAVAVKLKRRSSNCWVYLYL